MDHRNRESTRSAQETKRGKGIGLAGRAALAAALFAAVFCAASGWSLARADEKLPAKYREWLDRDVVYIIIKEERGTFLKLARDEDRDKFIENFWLARDPTPGTPENEYKDEHYKRIQHVNTYFGSEWNSDGWRTDRGKVWIILGQPASRQFHTSGGQIYPIELWFYNNPNEPSLPPFFYVMFYQKDGMSDYRLYSPYLDGPDKLVRASGAENSRLNGYKFLRDYNRELARASLTLIPSEPVDINNPPSLTSDGMLMKIINLANDRFHKERIDRGRQLGEQVSFRILSDAPVLQVALLPLEGPGGEDFIHYSLQIPDPPNYTLTRYKDKYYLSLEAQVRVLDAQKKLIYETTREAVAYYEEQDLDDVRTRPLSFEDKIPVVPGNYQLEFGLLNRVTRIFYRVNAAAQVEAHPAPALKLGRPLLIHQCRPAVNNLEPFTFGGTRCLPQAQNEVAAGAKSSVNLMYSVQMDPAGAPAGVGASPPLKVKYTLGKLDRSVTSRVTEDSLDRKRFDRSGVLVVGKSLPLGELPEGSYLLSIQVSDPVTSQTAGTTVSLRVGGTAARPPNVLWPAEPFREAENGNNDYWRGLAALAQNSREAAEVYLSRALQRNEQHQRARTQLAAIYYEKGDYQKVAELLEAGGVGKITEAATMQKFLASLGKTGQLKKAIETGEQAMARLEPTPELYQELAGLYEQSGQDGRARQAREEARRLTDQKKQGKRQEKK